MSDTLAEIEAIKAEYQKDVTALLTKTTDQLAEIRKLEDALIDLKTKYAKDLNRLEHHKKRRRDEAHKHDFAVKTLEWVADKMKMTDDDIKNLISHETGLAAIKHILSLWGIDLKQNNSKEYYIEKTVLEFASDDSYSGQESPKRTAAPMSKENEEIKGLKARIKALEEANLHVSNELKRLQEKIQILESERNSALMKYDFIQGHLDTKTREIEILYKVQGDLESKNDDLKEKLRSAVLYGPAPADNDLNEKYENLHQEYDTVCEERDDLRTKHEAEEKKSDRLKHQLDGLKKRHVLEKEEMSDKSGNDAEKTDSQPVHSGVPVINNTMEVVLGKEFDWKRALGITALTTIFWNLAYRPWISRLQNDAKRIKIWPAALAAGASAIVVQGYNYFFGSSDDDFEPVTTSGAPRVCTSRKGSKKSKKSKSGKVTSRRVSILKGIICGVLLASLSVLCVCFLRYLCCRRKSPRDLEDLNEIVIHE